LGSSHTKLHHDKDGDFFSIYLSVTPINRWILICSFHGIFLAAYARQIGWAGPIMAHQHLAFVASMNLISTGPRQKIDAFYLVLPRIHLFLAFWGFGHLLLISIQNGHFIGRFCVHKSRKYELQTLHFPLVLQGLLQNTRFAVLLIKTWTSF